MPPRPLPKLAGFAALVIAAILFAAHILNAPAAPQRMFGGHHEHEEDPRALLAGKASAQAEAAAGSRIFRDFRFEDRQPESGIDFRPDVPRFYAFYDHGTGLAAADADGDGLVDLYFASQVGGNRLFRNLGGGKFEDVTAASGAALADKVNIAPAFADVDNDGDKDLYVTSVRTGNSLLLNDGAGRFTDVSAESGAAYRGHSSAPLFFDYDRDGLIDLFVANMGEYTSREKTETRAGTAYHSDEHKGGPLSAKPLEQSMLFKNLGGGRFRDATAEAGLAYREWTGEAALWDPNGDGWPDLYVANMFGEDLYFENRNGKFTRRTADLSPRTSWGSVGAKAFDWNNDGLLDLYVTDMHSDMQYELPPGEEKKKSELDWNKGRFILGNSFFEAAADGAFREISDAIGAETYWPWGPSVGDLNADGWPDVFVTAGMGFPFRYWPNTLLLNENGEKFLDGEFLLGVEPRRAGRFDTEWPSVDCSLPADSRSGPCRAGQAPRGSLSSRGAAILDLDADGDLDIVTNEWNAPPQVLVSDLASRKRPNFLQVRLEGRASNRDGIGATVAVLAGGRRFTQFADGRAGYLSQGLAPLYFGLGEAPRAETVEIIWPSGRRQTVSEGIPRNGTLSVREPL